MTDHTRREFMCLGAATTVVGITGFSAASTQESTDNGWKEADSPTEATFNDAVNTAQGPFACGANGNVAARTQGGWELVVEYGPQARSRRLTGIDVTDDGEAVWFVGGSGVIGEYNVTTQTLTNYSAPMEMTSTWEDCAVRGNADENERLYFVNGSGELLVGVRQESGAVQYNDVIKPGGGSTIPGIDFNTREQGHVCSTSQFVAETYDGGETWGQIGIDFAGGSFFDIASQAEDDVNVAAGPGIIYRYDGFRWTPHVADDEREAIRAVAREGSEGLAAGDNGKVYERQSAGQWQRFKTPVEAVLNGVSRGDMYHVAVGANGTIVERQIASTDNEETTDADTASAEELSSSTLEQTFPEEPLSVENYIEGEWVSNEEDIELPFS
ncbi:hypothetical protein [Natrinema sp. SYSU A 869]|uniref:WD40/YVTN/BNR-like repeat-containing protein n=1 Tax=Natrinema sp. SYSU A 869 TaxID=2871694 RepID=UPI001CA3A628|nr:hypothetical protein [Natrinema sp. SYSU A 869]